MLTQCPNCQTIFRVTSEILRVADGQVRCGRCQTQFDALERLTEEPDGFDSSAAREDTDDIEGVPTDDVVVPQAPQHEEITIESQEEEPLEDSAAPQDATDEEPRMSEAERIAAEDRADYERAISSLEERSQPAPKPEASYEDTSLRFRARPLHRSAVDDNEAVPELDLLAAAPKPIHSPVWKALFVPLLLLLMVQWVHANRSDLARHPRFGAAIVNAYKAVGVPLTPAWDLHAYQIRQWGIASDPSQPGTLRVRASVTNLAEYAQPYPLLKLVLEDRWGEQVGAREFEPAEYLDSDAAAQRLMNPGQQANADLSIVDPGSDAEGFRFDVCLRGRAGTVCAEEVRRAR